MNGSASSRAPRPLYLVPVGEVDPDLAGWLAPELDRHLATRSRPARQLALSREWYDVRRDQYRSRLIVDALLAGINTTPGDLHDPWVLGITTADLFAEDRPFVFGEATVGGPCALVSTARLEADGSGSADPALLRGRVLKEALHELGHLAGLQHCGTEGCVMAESYDLKETDRKSGEFCPSCRPSLAALLSAERA